MKLIEFKVNKTGDYCDMTDIEVEDNHTFMLADGILTHNSAMSAVRKFRNPKTLGCFPLKGKFMNVLEKTNADVIKNDEVQGIVKSVGLKLGEDAFQMLELSGHKVQLILDDGTLTVDINEELFIDGKWVLVKTLLNLKPSPLEMNLTSRKIEGGNIVKPKTTLTSSKPISENVSGLNDKELTEKLNVIIPPDNKLF